jgi:hypothetical protein
MWTATKAGKDPSEMYERTLTKADHVRRFSITQQPNLGWEVREETDDSVTRQALYADWHRVERARRAFALEAMTLHQAGWTEE